MSKQLQEIIKQAKDQLEDTKQAGARGGYVCVIGYENLKALIKQAERVQELEGFKSKVEKLYKYTHLNAKKSIAEKTHLEEQNKRYREAIESLHNIIGARSSDVYYTRQTRREMFDITKKALEREET